MNPLEPFTNRHGKHCWRSKCDCGWTSRDLPFPDPDAALHALALHKVLCKDADATRP